MACNGVVFLSLKLNLRQLTIEHSEFHFLGLPKNFSNDHSHFDLFLANQFSLLDFKDLEKSKEELRICLRRYFDNQLGYKPTTVVHIL